MTEPRDNTKPVVFYRGTAQIELGVGDNRRAMLFALNHPRLGCTTVHTSRIVNMSDCGIIETLNTIYEPINEEYL